MIFNARLAKKGRSWLQGEPLPFVGAPHLDILAIIGLKVETTIGCCEWETAITQPLYIDLFLKFDNTLPSASDSLEDAIDYNTLATQLRIKMQLEKNKLIETVAEKMAAWVLEDKRVKEVKVVVHKRHAVNATEDTYVSITRSHVHHQPAMFDL